MCICTATHIHHLPACLYFRPEQGNPIPLERVQQALHRHAPAPKPDGGAVVLEHNLAVLISGTKPAQ